MECKDCFVGGNESKKEEESRKTSYIFYLLIFLGAALVAWTAMDYFSPHQAAQVNSAILQAAAIPAASAQASQMQQAAAAPAVALDSSGKVANTAQNQQIFQQQAASAGSECGDLNNPANLQHLSHHPNLYQDCYKLIDPQKFKAAVGKDISEFMR
ncbi:MAG: hypothetical protein V1822_01315 [Candidatus Micrarchaeota archaeon]